MSKPKYKDPLTPQERRAITVIARNPRIGPKELGDQIGATKDVVSRVVARLVKLGWVYERKNPEDRRFTQLGMTKAGERGVYEWAAHENHMKLGSFKITDIHVWTGQDGQTEATIEFEHVPAEKDEEETPTKS
jgi:DNA-binding MarR family transcriptional regulator